MCEEVTKGIPTFDFFFSSPPFFISLSMYTALTLLPQKALITIVSEIELCIYRCNSVPQ